jgi:radical SAM superfamily enzyme YgiQ (UPF0313 family)
MSNPQLISFASVDAEPGEAARLKAYAAMLGSMPVRRPRRLLLINPPQVPGDMFDAGIAKMKGYYNFPPVGLLYLCAAARQADPECQVSILDLNHEMLVRSHQEDFDYTFWKERVSEEIRRVPEVFVGVSCMFGATKPIFEEIACFIKEHFPRIPVLTGGVQATYDYDEILTKGVCDLVFLKESEEPFSQFLRHCREGCADNMPRGLAFRRGKSLHVTAPLEGTAPVNLDIRPFYSLLDVPSYYKYGSLAAFSRYNGEDKPFATVLSNRGCRARCTFCTVRDFNGYGVRTRPVSDVVDEIKFMVRELGIRQIDWLDDDLLFEPDRTLELLKSIAREVPELEWISNNGLIGAAISPEIMDWMVKSGMKAFKIGIESGNDKMLKTIKKPTTKPKLRNLTPLFDKYPEVLASGNFIIGFPNETFGEMLDTYNFAAELKWDWASFYICQPLKGTEMFSVFQSLGDERCDYENYDKTLNPGRAAARGEFGYNKGYHGSEAEQQLLTGRDVFKLPKDKLPSKRQIQEIWFTFNLIVNFLENKNLEKGGNPGKILRWLGAIGAAYPYDASMIAALCRAQRVSGDIARSEESARRFHDILDKSEYWRTRVRQFPEIADLVKG